MEFVSVFCGDELVGEMLDPVPDMWCLEGKFVPTSTDAGIRFAAEASALDIKTTYFDHTRAIRGVIRSSPTDSGTTVLVLSLSNSSLCVRRVFESDAVQWVNENVPDRSS